MTREEAIKLNDNLKFEISQGAEELKLKNQYVVATVEQHIMIVPDDARKGILFLGDSSATYKPGNIRIDFKNAIVAALELLISLNEPESIFNYIQLLLATIISINRAVKIDVGQRESCVVYFLHEKNMYDNGIEEQELINHFTDRHYPREEIVNAINNLYKIKVIDISEGKISLIEKIWEKGWEQSDLLMKESMHL